MKILIYDIETSPLICYTWGLWKQNAAMLKQDWRLLTVSWKWLGQRGVEGVTAQNFASEKAFTKHIWKLFDEADVLVAHNGNSFDQKKMTAKFIEHGFPPPTPYAQIDTKLVLKKVGRFTSNSLDNICSKLGHGRKVKHQGIELWDGCLQGKTPFFTKMLKYNKQDVRLLEKLYLTLRPWTTAHPNVNRKGRSCPKCGSSKLRSHGHYHTKTASYRRLRCRSCSGFSRERLKDPSQIQPEITN